MNRKYKEKLNCLITSNKLRMNYWVTFKFIEYDVSKRLKVLLLFETIIEWGKEFHNFSPWYNI